MNDLVENASEKKYRFRLDYMDEELTVDEFIRGRMKKVVDSNIETMVESKAKSFVNELRKRYDMAFAAFVVDSMRKQNMLKDEKIAELLKDNPDERWGGCQRKAAIGAHDTARTGEGQGIIPGMV